MQDRFADWGFAGRHQTRGKKRQKSNQKGFIVEEVTDRDIRMASAYGGVAKPRMRKVDKRFATAHRARDNLTQNSSTRLADP